MYDEAVIFYIDPQNQRLQARLLREDAGLTQVELAERLNTTQSDVSRWENRKGGFSVEKFYELAQACGFELILRRPGR